MKAAYLTAIEKVELGEAPEPKMRGPRDVLLQVEAVGVCGSDIHYDRTGRIGEQVVEFPWILGHECSARVVEVGEAVRNVQAGQRVAIDPLVACGRCDQCLAGRPHTCRNQTFLGCPGQARGAMAERLVMPSECCFPVPPQMTATQVVLLEPLAICVYAAAFAGDPTGKTVAILGSGPIGLCVLLALKAAGDCTVYCTDLIDERLTMAARLGADWTADAGRQDVVADALKAEPLGVDFAFECAGEQETLDQGLELLKPGGQFMLLGIPEADRISFQASHMRRKELVLQNVRRQNHAVGPTIDMVTDGRINPDPLATHHFPLDRAAAAFETVAGYRDGVVRAIIHLTE